MEHFEGLGPRAVTPEELKAAIADLKVYVREREYQQVPVVSVQLHPQHEPQQLYSMHKQQVKFGMQMVQCCK